MTANESFPALLITGLACWLVASLGVMAYGRKLPRRGDWVVGIPLLYLIVILSIGLSDLGDGHFSPKNWGVGWIGPHDSIGAITVGILLDPLGAMISLLALVVSAVFVLNRSYLASEEAPERSFAALGVSATGVALAWSALTPWLVLCGLGLTVVGALLATGARWDSESESNLAARFAWERSWGVVVAVMGLCVLAGTRGAVRFGDSQAWTSAPTDLLGAALLMAGLFAQFAPFPWVGSLLTPSSVSAPILVLTRQFFPALCAFALLTRFDSQLRAIGIFPHFGWVALGSAFLTVGSGVFQKDWRTGLATWLSAGLSLSLAALAFVGPRVATSFFIPVGLASVAFACSAFTLSSKQSGSSKATWTKFALILSAAAGTGMIGFTSAGGGLRASLALMDRPAELGFFALVLFLFGILGWSLALKSSRLGEVSSARWPELLTPFLFIILALGALWTGTATGGALHGLGGQAPDQLFQPIFDLFFGPEQSSSADQANFGAASGVFWGATILGLIVGFSTAGGGRDSWSNLSQAFPRFSGFLGRGYSIEVAAQSILKGVTRAGAGAEWLLNRQLWDRWVPLTLTTGVRRGATFVAQADTRIGDLLNEATRWCIEAPARGLQAIQNGDVRWYLFFAIGSGLAILLNYVT